MEVTPDRMLVELDADDEGDAPTIAVTEHDLVALPDELAEASQRAWEARRAMVARDVAVRAAVAAGCSKRWVAEAVGMSPPAIDRIIEREGAAGTRW